MEARSSQSPAAALAIRSAVAGATTTRSAERESSMWPISASSVSDSSAWWTFSPQSAESDRGVTNSAPARVRIGETEAPALARSRTSSSAL